MTDTEKVRVRYQHAKIVHAISDTANGSEHRYRVLAGVRFNGTQYLGKWCTTEARAWEAAARVLTHRVLDKMDE